MTANGSGGTSDTDKGGPATGVPPVAGADGRLLVAVEPARPWLPAAVVTLVAVVVLLILVIPGVLRYPAPAEPPPAPDRTAVDAQRQSNRALEDRIASLRRLLDAGVCVADGNFQLPPNAPGAQSLAPEDRAAIPPPPPERTPAPTAPAADGQPFNGSLLDLLDRSTVLVLQTDAQGKMIGSGTGFIVAPGKILTNRHVVEGETGNRLHVVNRAVGAVQARVIAESPAGTPGSPDFALLGIERADRGVPLGFAPPAERLVNVVAAGFPGMVLATDERFRKLLSGEADEAPTASVTEGVITAVQQGNGTNIVLHTAQITPGNSGGPLVDRCGRVVGINTFILAREEGRLNYALASADLVRFLAAQNVPVTASTAPCSPPAPGTQGQATAPTAPGTPAAPPAANPPATSPPATSPPAAAPANPAGRPAPAPPAPAQRPGAAKPE
ncbi:trypsin-like peptidase domain-containing protein [Azospirillum sp. RWY-5-1]|uniref:Trypsin-like peptidase domain-containing protein n=1 Tax=Azospirillum oleiclasticum TaxID=2735135 RepID=A0ABX2T865_9PROT|nr:serine protease [Azospirillum oleiclasticum]NYZ12948.1 trypsin-like peptidase domain-containing protein [Azospirillum oleiclasticum]NYZ20379.1 trypsin-like peptidase domain-containing protein [Azospirillum oleiclasticum]